MTAQGATANGATEAVAEEHTLGIAGMTCAACQMHVQHALLSVPGVENASVDLLGRRAEVLCSEPVSTEALAAAVQNAGYRVVERTGAGEDTEDAAEDDK